MVTPPRIQNPWTARPSWVIARLCRSQCTSLERLAEDYIVGEGRYARPGIADLCRIGIEHPDRRREPADMARILSGGVDLILPAQDIEEEDEPLLVVHLSEAKFRLVQDHLITRCSLFGRTIPDRHGSGGARPGRAPLEQAFNSLDAQREACAAYIMSQCHEGWQAIPELYNDGGYSGGSMNRPGLLQLLEDVSAGKVDVIIVYKVDRLTRSLADFAKIIEVLDKHSASFVSVTQASILPAAWGDSRSTCSCRSHSSSVR
jgi:hypothetical protein